MVGAGDPFFERDFVFPSQGVKFADIEEFSGSAVGLFGVLDDGAFETDHFLYESGHLGNRYIFSSADVDDVVSVVVIHQKYAGVREIVNVEKFSFGCAGAPDDGCGGACKFGFVKFSHKRGKDVGGVEVKVVERSVEISGHYGNVFGIVLSIVGLAHFDAGDFCHRVGLVGGLKGTREEVFFLDGLGAVARVDAGAPQEEEFFDTREVGIVDDVHFDPEVLVNEIGGEVVVGFDASDFGGGEDDVFRFLGFKELLHSKRVKQVEFFKCAHYQIGVAIGGEVAHQCTSHESGMPSDVDF